MAGTLFYGAVRSRIKDFRFLLHSAVVLGIASTIAYWAVRDEMSARTTCAAAGFTTAVATLVQLDLAAQVCPLNIAGTVFAVLMSLSNLSMFLSAWLGGICYERLRGAWGDQLAFDLLVALGGTTTAACWLVVPRFAPNCRLTPRAHRARHSARPASAVGGATKPRPPACQVHPTPPRRCRTAAPNAVRRSRNGRQHAVGGQRGRPIGERKISQAAFIPHSLRESRIRSSSKQPTHELSRERRQSAGFSRRRRNSSR